MSNLTVAATFTRNTGQPATELTLAEIDLYLTAHDKSTGADTVVWNGTQNPTEEIDNCGTYARIYADADMDDYDYFARASYTGAAVLDVDHVIGATEGPSPWDYGTRTLTQSAAQIQAAVEGEDITILRGDSLSASLTGMGSLTGYVSLDFSVKESRADSDDDAIIRIRLNASGLDDGLLRVNKAAAADASLGSVTVDDAVAGDITITLDETVTDDLIPWPGLHYDVQKIDASDVQTMTEGRAEITADVTRLVS